MFDEINKVVVHNGTFHADDVLAIVLLKYAGFHGTVVRSRDVQIEDDGCCLFVDVGEKYDGRRWFDHHQKDAPIRTVFYGRNASVKSQPAKFCSSGQLWQIIGPWIAQREFPDDVEIQQRFFARVDKELLLSIDLSDNGNIKEKNDHSLDSVNLSVNKLIAASNSMTGPEIEHDRRFHEVVNCLFPLIRNYFEGIIAGINGEGEIKRCIDRALTDDSLYVFLDDKCNVAWKGVVQGDQKTWENINTSRIRAFVFKNANGPGYCLSMLPRTRTAKLENKYVLYEGLKDKFPGEFTFIHDSGFFGVVKTRDHLDDIMRSLKRN